MALPTVVTREEWREARIALLAEEKALTRARDELSTRRRNLPMVRVDKEYLFEGPDGQVTLLDLFDGRRQLIVRHFMFDPGWESGCKSCTAGADELCDGLFEHLRARETNLVVIARAPFEKLERYRAGRGWSFPLYSSFGSDFNYDYHVTLASSVAPVEYNYRDRAGHEAAGTGPCLEGGE